MKTTTATNIFVAFSCVLTFFLSAVMCAPGDAFDCSDLHSSFNREIQTCIHQNPCENRPACRRAMRSIGQACVTCNVPAGAPFDVIYRDGLARLNQCPFESVSRPVALAPELLRATVLPVAAQPIQVIPIQLVPVAVAATPVPTPTPQPVQVIVRATPLPTPTPVAVVPVVPVAPVVTPTPQPIQVIVRATPLPTPTPVAVVPVVPVVPVATPVATRPPAPDQEEVIVIRRPAPTPVVRIETVVETVRVTPKEKKVKIVVSSSSSAVPSLCSANLLWFAAVVGLVVLKIIV